MFGGRVAAVCSVACGILLTACGARAQQPAAYTVTVENGMFGPPVEETVYRDGSRAVIDLSTPATADAKATHMRSLYDLTAHTDVSWDLVDSSGGCGRGNFSGDWGDPFTSLVDLSTAKMTGTETVNGFAAKVYVANVDSATAKLWIDAKTGLAVKIDVTQAGQTKTISEVKKFTVGAPAAVFVLPAVCTVLAGPPPPTQQEKDIAAETKSKVGDFIDAVTTADTGTATACSVQVRVMQAESMKPITSGFKLSANAIDDAKLAQGDTSPGANIPVSMGANGVARIDNPPAHFNLMEDFGNAGGGGGMIRRWCAGPVETLLLVVKDPQNLGKGVDLLWDKNGKYK